MTQVPAPRSRSFTALAAILLMAVLALAGCRPDGLDTVRAARAMPIGADAGSLPRWQWPLDPEPHVLRAFDPPKHNWLAGHRGVDLAAPAEAVVLSPAEGTVHFSGWVVDRPVLTLRFEEAGVVRLSSFEPVEALLAVGTEVSAGEPVGRAVSSAARHCPLPCVHWGVREDGEYVDPLQFVMDTRPSVLLPLPGRAVGAPGPEHARHTNGGRPDP